MNKLRVLAWVVLALIAADFIFMIVSLAFGAFGAFFIAGGALVGLLIVGFVLKKAGSRLKTEDQDHAAER